MSPPLFLMIPGAPTPVAPFSHAVEVDGWVFVTGQMPTDPEDDSRPLAGLVYLGNDLNDLPIMRRAGFTVAPADAHWRVKEQASVVLQSKGGRGFVREFIERLLGIETMSLEEIDVLIRNS